MIERVHVRTTDHPQPVYHAFRETRVLATGRTEDSRFELVMQCGQRWPKSAWWSAVLRREHADLFGRPCARCFPELVRDVGINVGNDAT